MNNKQYIKQLLDYIELYVIMAKSRISECDSDILDLNDEAVALAQEKLNENQKYSVNYIENYLSCLIRGQKPEDHFSGRFMQEFEKAKKYLNKDKI